MTMISMLTDYLFVVIIILCHVWLGLPWHLFILLFQSVFFLCCCLLFVSLFPERVCNCYLFYVLWYVANRRLSIIWWRYTQTLLPDDLHRLFSALLIGQHNKWASTVPPQIPIKVLGAAVRPCSVWVAPYGPLNHSHITIYYIKGVSCNTNKYVMRSVASYYIKSTIIMFSGQS